MSTAVPRLIHVGNVVMDIVLDVASLPVRGEDVIALRNEITPGGAFNVMVAAVRQGLTTLYGGALGTGRFATIASVALSHEGIPVISQPLSSFDTGYVVCFVDAEGERTFVTAPGAEAMLSLSQLEAIDIASNDIVCISGYSMLYPHSRQALLSWIENLSPTICVVFDPGPLVAEISDQVCSAIVHRANWITTNAREAAILTNTTSASHAAIQLAQRTSYHNVIVRDGPDGCILIASGKKPEHIPGFKVCAVDTNGAGDAHTGSFVAALAAGVSPHDATRWANATAALAVTRHGPATAPSWTEVQRFVTRHH